MQKYLLSFALFLISVLFNNAMAQVPCSGGEADFIYSANSSQPCCIQFSPCSSAGFGTWNFGDGNSQGGVQGTVHCYTTPGNYVVTHTFNGKTVQKNINVGSCQECDLVAKYCLTDWDCTQVGPWSYYCYDTYTDLSLGSAHTSSWEVCYETNSGSYCETLTGASITVFTYSYQIFSPTGYAHYYKRVRSVCLTIKNSICEKKVCEPSCPLPIVDPGQTDERSQLVETPQEPVVFPNPVRAGENLTIQMADGKQSYHTRLMDVSGKVLHTQTVAPGSVILVPTENCTRGLHLLVVTGDDGKQVVRKVVVE